MNVFKIPFSNITRDEQETLIDGQSVESLIKNNIAEVMKNKDFILGGYLEKFEKEFANYCGVKHCVGVSSGLAALELALIGIGIKSGDEVITVANTFNATVAAIAKIGAKPVLVDASYNDFNLDVNQVESKINNKTKAIIPVHLYGQTMELNRLNEIANKYNISIIEDACQSHGSKFDGKKAGSFGIAGCFSFYPGKNLGAYGDGGAIITNDDKLADFLRKTRNYGQAKKYFHEERPDNNRLDTIQAAVLIEKLKALDRWNMMRVKNAEIYRQELKNVNEIELPSERKNGGHIYHLFVIKAEKRDELEKYLAEKGVQTLKHYPTPIHLQPCFANLGYKKGDFPISEKLSDNILSLPMFPTLKQEEIKYITDCIKEFYSNKK